MKEIEQIKTIKEFNKEIEIINNKLDHLYYKHEKVRNFKAYLHEYFSFSLFDIMIYPFIFLFVSLLDLIYWIGYLIKYRDSYKLGIRDVKTKIYELGDRLEILINKKNQLLLIPIEVCIGKSLPNIKYLKSHSFGYVLKNGKIISLGLSHCSISDLSVIPFDLFPNLESLYLTENKIKDIKPLVGLKNLRILCLSDNQIESVRGLENLEKLEKLYLDFNDIKNIHTLTPLKNLRKIGLRENPVLVRSLPKQFKHIL